MSRRKKVQRFIACDNEIDEKGHGTVQRDTSWVMNMEKGPGMYSLPGHQIAESKFAPAYLQALAGLDNNFGDAYVYYDARPDV